MQHKQIIKRLWQHLTDEQRIEIIKQKREVGLKIEEIPLAVALQLEYKQEELRRVMLLFSIIIKSAKNTSNVSGNKWYSLSLVLSSLVRLRHQCTELNHKYLLNTMKAIDNTECVKVEYIKLHPAR
jgi:DNA-binding transcriptional MerR regulator